MPTIQEAVTKVREFANLPDGWHFGDGVAPPLDRIERAVHLIRRGSLLGLKRANAFPGVNGQVEVTFYDDDRMLEITIETDGSLTVAENKSNRQLSLSEGLSASHAYERLNTWASSDLYTDSITILNVPVRGFRPQHLTFEVENQSQWLTATAPLPRAGQFVGTFFGITTSRLEIQPYIGPFQVMYSRPAFGLNWDTAQLVTSAIVTFTGEDTLLDEFLAA